MTNSEKAVLRRLIREGNTFEEIRILVDCSDQTIKNYIRAIRGIPVKEEGAKNENAE